MTTIPVSVMIFTLNEEVHLPSCFAALGWCDDIIVVDSFSQDNTQALCESAGVRFFQHPFTGFGSQRNWALAHTAPRHSWVLILDADERVTPELATEMAVIATHGPSEIGAYRVKRRFYMWGRWLRYSSLYPTWVVRLIHRDKVVYADRGHAETQTVQGMIGDLSCDLIDENLKGIDEWFERQNRYSRKEATFELNDSAHGVAVMDLFSNDPLVRRATIKRLSRRVPARGLLYFLYSYVWKRGFLDGRDGLVFCLMRAMYQSQIAIKKYDAQRQQPSDRKA